MNEIPRDQSENNTSQEPDDPLPPLADVEPIVERVSEIHSDSEPKKSPRQRLGSMAARRSARVYEDGERPQHITEQAIITEMSRPMFRRSVKGPRAA
jgi:hypothetical protein